MSDSERASALAREIIDRALREIGEPPFPILERVIVSYATGRLALDIELRFRDGVIYHIRHHHGAAETPPWGGVTLFTRLLHNTYLMSALSDPEHAARMDRDWPERAHAELEEIRMSRSFNTIRTNSGWRPNSEWLNYANTTTTTTATSARAAQEVGQRSLEQVRQNMLRALQEQQARAQADYLYFGFDLAPAPARNTRPEAEAKGRALLWANITPTQRNQLATLGYFEVIGGSSGSTYRIYHGTQQNVVRMGSARAPTSDLLDQLRMSLRLITGDTQSKTDMGFCFTYPGLVPGDAMLGQKLSLELEEKKAIQDAVPFYPYLESMGAKVEHALPQWQALHCVTSDTPAST